MSPRETVRHRESQVICREYREMLMVRSRTMLDNTPGTTMMKWKWFAAAIAAAAASGSGKYAGQSPSYLVSLPLLQSNHCVLLFIKFPISNPSYKTPILYSVQNKNSVAFCKSSLKLSPKRPLKPIAFPSTFQGIIFAIWWTISVNHIILYVRGFTEAAS